MNLSKNIKISVIAAAAVAGTSTITSNVTDMQGFDGIIYLALTGDATSGTVLTLQAYDNTANATGGAAVAITGGVSTYTSLSASDADSKVLFVDIFRPQNRYQYCTLARATQNCVLGGIIAIQYTASKKPTAQDLSVIASAFAVGT